MANEENLTAPRFKPGESGNPGGKTSAQRAAEIRNAEKATLLRERLLDVLVNKTDMGATMDDIDAVILKLLKDSEDRGLGTATQSVNLESPKGTMSPSVIERQIVKAKVNNQDE